MMQSGTNIQMNDARTGRCERHRTGNCVRRLGPVASGCVWLSLVCGCATPEPREPMPFADAGAFSSTGTLPLDARWWQAFEDPDLDTRVDQALRRNFTLAEAWERLRAAAAVVDVERSALFPRIDGVGSGSVREGRDIDRETELRLGLEASYELDLWGRIRAAVEADRFRAAASAEDLQAAAISVSAEVTLTWYELAESLLQLELIASQLETNQKVLAVLEQRFAVGQGGSADVLRQRQLVEATREQAVVVRAQAAVLQNRLAVLGGRPPQGATAARPASLPRIPDWPDTGLPAELLERRPDVRAALLRLEATDRDVAEAVRDQYPRIDLVAVLETVGENPAGLFDDWLAALTARLVAPLYDGGQREAEIERRVALRRASLAQYGQAVLAAFREVEDALAQESLQVERIERLREQQRLAASTYEQLRGQYLNGVADFLEVLISLREQQQLERDVLAAELDRLRFRVALYRALAGGFELPESAAGSIQTEPGLEGRSTR